MKPKIIKTKHELHWHIISNYLDDISNFWVAHTDEDFKKILTELKSYVNKKLALDGDGEVIDFFVVYLQQSDD